MIRQSSASVGLGLASTANQPGSGLSDALITTADCSSWELYLRPPPDRANDVAVAPGGCCRYPAPGLHLSPLFTLTPFLLCFASGALKPLGQASKLYFFALLRSPMDVSLLLSLRRRPAIHRWLPLRRQPGLRCRPASSLNAVSMSPACLFATGLPLGHHCCLRLHLPTLSSPSSSLLSIPSPCGATIFFSF